MITILINCLFLMLVGGEGQELLLYLVDIMRAFVVDLSFGLLLLLQDHLITL